MVATTWGPSARRIDAEGGFGRKVETLTRIAAMLLVAAVVARPWIAQSAAPDDQPADVTRQLLPGAGALQQSSREIFIAGYVGAPFYYRSNVHLKRADGTDLELKRLGWDGDALYFPIDGGVRTVQWWQPAGFMIDFLHNKAIARLGRGAHGRKLSNPVIEEVETTGTFKGQPAPPRMKLTDVFERLEFTHGHNVLLFTPMLRLFAITPSVRPYFGLGGGVAVPHVEVWHPGEPRENRTNEYQYSGPAAQFVAGIELRVGKWSYFVEYKFTYAWIAAALTGDESWKNFNMPGDMLRQLQRWWRSEPPKLGTLSTRLGAHQVVVGAGYWWDRGAKTP